MGAGTMTSANLLDPAALNRAAPNPFQPSAGPLTGINDPGNTNRGLCTLSYGGQVYRFRTNPNEIWWSYELITHIEETYGGRVVQILGTQLGDLTVKVECGLGGWDYLMETVTYLRDLISDQRNGSTATFEYTTRNWKLNVYAMSIPFQDQVDATVRELELHFKIQEDVSGVISAASLNAELARLQDGVYKVGQNVHNEYNDWQKAGTGLNGLLGGDPKDPTGGNRPGGGVGPTGTANTVDSNPQGNNPLGLNPLQGLPFLPNIPGLGILGGLLG